LTNDKKKNRNNKVKFHVTTSSTLYITVVLR